MGSILLLLAGCAAILSAVLIINSPGTLEPYRNPDGTTVDGSIAEKARITINGVQQGMFIKGRDTGNPVLLFLHGGPGMPEYFLTEQYPTGLEDHFTVCYWEQRHAGISYSARTPVESLTTEQYVADTIAVTEYLRERFGKEKIYLMAHSGGSYFGIRAAAKAPELYEAYIGIGQISNQRESEKRAYAYMAEQYAAAGNTKMAEKLKAYPILQSDEAMAPYLASAFRDDAMHLLGIGTMRDMKSVFKGIFLPVMNCRAYTVTEKINLWRGKAVLKKVFWGEIIRTDLSEACPRFDIPVYFMSGAFDYTVSTALSQAYLEQLEAPLKGFYLFGQSAHSPLFEEPERFMTIMEEDVLKGRSDLSSPGGPSEGGLSCR